MPQRAVRLQRIDRVLAAAIGVMNEIGEPGAAAVVDRLLERIEDEIARQVLCRPLH